MEYVFGSLWFWIGVVAVVALIAGAINHWVSTTNATKRHVADAANGGDYKRFAEEANLRARRVSEQLDELDDRLARIEKTLTDIPG